MMYLSVYVPPRVNESLVGYLMRAAEQNGLKSRETVLQLFQETPNRLPNYADAERLAAFTGCTLEEVIQLFGFERRREDGVRCWRIGSEWVTKGNFVSSRTLACCPYCLREMPYLPGIWELSFYRVCAIHRIALIDHCPSCGRPFRWTRTHLLQCQCGQDLRTMPASPGSPGSLLLAQLIEHRLDPTFPLVVPSTMPSRVVERLANLSLDGLFKTIWFLGHCVCQFQDCGSGHGRKRPNGEFAEAVIEQAFNLLSEWPVALGVHLSAIANIPTSNSSASLYLRKFGPIAKYLSEDLAEAEFAFVHQAFERQVRTIWKEMGKSRPPRVFVDQLEFDF